MSVEAFGLQPDGGGDATLAVLRAIDYCRDIPGATLVFPEGTYHFWPDLAFERQYYISNHDQEKTRRIAFPLLQMNGFTIDGQGSTFMMHGFTTPFAIDHSSDITLTRFTIDYARSTISQGTVVHSDESGFEVCIPEEYPYEVSGGKLIAVGEGWKEPVKGIIVMDPKTKAPKQGSGDILMWGYYDKGRVEESGDRRVRYSGFTHYSPDSGDVVLLQSGYRDCPGIFVNDSRNILVSDVDLHACIGMGFIAQNSKDLHLRAFNVTPRPHSDRLFSASADATHFVNCEGKIKLENCLFENQMDDPCNVHSIYAQIAERQGEELLCRLVHPQQRGIRIFSQGDQVRLVRNDSLLPYFESQVKAVRAINAEYMLLELETPLPSTINGGDGLENLTRIPDLHVRGCVAKANRARGFLITTPGHVLFEGNIVSTPGAAIKISGDANYWFESGAVRSVTIRENVFEDCNYCYPFWGKGMIDIDPEIEQPELFVGRYHEEIVIERNLFRTFHPVLVSGQSVAGLRFADNQVELSRRYPQTDNLPYVIDLKACSDVEVSGNRCEGGVLVSRINGKEIQQPLAAGKE
ncbi:hypothetical protein M3194_06565 [Paenibacillus glycanilyticus]|uniref:alpha-1,3-galactosidase-related protein n=1 Tax=Paenibacillus glycanilyticus TaxID=126569 RepID=UPI00203C1147|nr:hypothetical protein [Paenibacillus glycanilyticus]MCM3627023.1 hypothetical protein [Paenibacillus glycanilyticus]